MPKKTIPPVPGTGRADTPANVAVKPAIPAKPAAHWAAKQGRGFAPVQKPLRLPGKGRGG